MCIIDDLIAPNAWTESRYPILIIITGILFVVSETHFEEHFGNTVFFLSWKPIGPCSSTIHVWNIFDRCHVSGSLFASQSRRISTLSTLNVWHSWAETPSVLRLRGDRIFIPLPKPLSPSDSLNWDLFGGFTAILRALYLRPCTKDGGRKLSSNGSRCGPLLWNTPLLRQQAVAPWIVYRS